MSDLPSLLLTVVWHSLLIYALLIAGLAWIGRPLMAERTLPGLLVIALIGSAVESPLYAGSDSLLAGIASAATLLLANRGMTSVVLRSARLRRLLIGVPVVLVHDGQLAASQLRRVGLTEADVMAAVRSHGYEKIEELRFALLEVNGSVSVIPREGA